MSDEEDISGPPPSARGRRQSVCAEPFNPNAVEDEDTPKEQTSEVMDAMFERKVTAEEKVIEQGDDGDNFYVIDGGKFDIFVNEKNVGSYNEEGSFGELALMYNTPRAASIVATTDATIWGLDRATFRRIMLVAAFKKRKMYEEFLETVPIFSSLERYERMTLADGLYSEKFSDGATIITQGEEADKFYLVERGEVSIKMQKDDDVKEVAHLQKGGYFGELALVTKKERAASAYAVGDVTLACLDVGAFERLLGPCMDIMKRNFTNYEEQLVKIFGTSLNLTDVRT
ncbi:cAMP-dependent protein kinase type II-alpha regulatory subunit-like isoform X2 [Sycon ciliatum]|uniref:cAMP-dependent protein kinase type II-alpha regulatory subunit-like isoform X2 n=1 Tax=Sycon ciliatum TaxID=27933 RepID=UPI0031F6D249